MSEEQRWSVPVSAGTDLVVRAYPGEDDRPVVVVWPALGVPARFYETFVPPLREQGFSVALADYRKVDGRASRFGYHDFASTDFPAVVAEARKRFPGRPVLLLGHSLGGQIALAYASRRPEEVDGIVLVAASTPYYRAYPPRLAARTLLATQLVGAGAAVLGYWPGDKLKFGGRQSKVLLGDWARLSRTGRFRFTGVDADYERSIAELKVPVLAVSVEGDTYAPPSAVDALVGKLTSADVTRWHHQPERRLDHFRWVKAGEPIARRIGDWWQRTHTV
jgi:predicted alpha/beta hydrolase